MDSITSLELEESINIQSPDYPDNYGSSEKCTISINSSDILVLQFHDIDIYGVSGSCYEGYDYLSVNDIKYCGNSIVRSLFLL
jgi:hypothetical protein